MDYSQFAQAIYRFKEALDYYNSSEYKKDVILCELVAESLTQRFEYTLEVAWKTCKRYLKYELGFNEASTGSPKMIMRLAYSVELVDDARIWIEYIDARQSTSHEYAEEKLDRVVALCPSFFASATALYTKMTGSTYEQQCKK